jgi:hypothetical protein
MFIFFFLFKLFGIEVLNKLYPLIQCSWVNFIFSPELKNLNSWLQILCTRLKHKKTFYHKVNSALCLVKVIPELRGITPAS